MTDIDMGLTHVALPVTDPDASVAFYERYAAMKVVHRRRDEAAATTVVWLSDLTRPFVVVLVEAKRVDGGLGGFAHLGVACESRAEVDRRGEQARSEGRTVLGPYDSGPPVGYWLFIADPDGHNLELSHGQEVAFTIEHAS